MQTRQEEGPQTTRRSEQNRLIKAVEPLSIVLHETTGNTRSLIGSVTDAIDLEQFPKRPGPRTEVRRSCR